MEKIPKMLKLPDLAIWLICDQLSYEDLRNLRATCKQLKAIIDQRPFRSLHLFLECYPCEQELFHTGESVGYANSLHICDLCILKSTEFRKQFSELRKLTIHYVGWNTCDSSSDLCEFVDLNDLNCFQELVYLQFDYVTIENSRLSLRNLKIVSFNVSPLPVTTFELDCPRLEALSLGARLQPRLTPETSNSLRHLLVQFAEESETYLMILYQKLKNLSTISFSTDSDLNNFVLALMEHRVCLPSLKKINLEKPEFFSDRGVLLQNLAKFQSRHDTGHYEVLFGWKKMSTNHLIELLNLLDRLIPLKDPEETDWFSWGNPVGRLLRSLTENPILHCLLPGVSSLRLCSNEELTLGKQLIGKLRNLTSLFIGKGVEFDDQFFECILQRGRKVSYLNIGRVYLNQQQLNRLPNYFQSLGVLKFHDDFLLGNFNLDFVAKFKNLIYLDFNFNIDKETMRFLLKSCNHQAIFGLIVSPSEDIFINIERQRDGRFEIIEQFTEEKVEFDCMENAIEYYYRNDLFNHPDRLRGRSTHWIRCCLM